MARIFRQALPNFLGQPTDDVSYIDFMDVASSSTASDEDRRSDNRVPPEISPLAKPCGLPNVPLLLEGATVHPAPRWSESNALVSPLHPDDDWFSQRTADDALGAPAQGLSPSEPNDRARQTVVEARHATAAANAQAFPGLDAGLAALVDEGEGPSPAAEIRREDRQGIGGHVVEEADDWPFEHPPTEHGAEPSDPDDLRLPSWAGDHAATDAQAFDDPEQRQEGNAAWRAGAQAAALVEHLDFRSRAQRSRMLSWLDELLREFPHGASHAAIARLVLSGLPIDGLRDVAAVVRGWREDPSLWLVRRGWVVEIDRRHGRTGLSWSKAAALLERVDVTEALELLTSV